MGGWTFFDYAEDTGRNRIREWLDKLPPNDQAKIDRRLLTMVALDKWPEKWVSKYESAGTLYEFRITGNKIQYRPLGNYFGHRRYVILAGAIEKGDKIPKYEVDTALKRQSRLEKDPSHAIPHEFDP